MLINTVLIFLQNILPIFVVISLLTAQQSTRCKIQNNASFLPLINVYKRMTIGLIIVVITSISIVLLFSYYMATLSQLFSGSGLEIIFSVLFILIYCFIALSFLISHTSRYKSQHPITSMRQQIAFSFVITFLVFCVHGSYFSLYVMSLTLQDTPFVIGVIIGTGISLSIAILFYFILTAINKKTTTNITFYFLLIFGVGQLMQAIQLLEQVDVISSYAPLWSTNNLIAENSEFGYFLTILFGYEATPSAMQLTLYVIAIIVPIIFTKLMAHRQHNQASLTKGVY